MTDKITAAPFATKVLALSAALEHAKANPYIDYTYRTEPVWNGDREVVGFHLILMDDEGYTVREIGDAEARDLLAARLVSEVKEEASEEWLRDDSGNTTLLYTLKQKGWHRGKPIMVNDKTVRIERDGDREPLIATILQALTTPEVKSDKLRDVCEGLMNLEGLVFDSQKPDRVKIDGEWHYGPLATAYIRLVDEVSKLASEALRASK